MNLGFKRAIMRMMGDGSTDAFSQAQGPGQEQLPPHQPLIPNRQPSATMLGIRKCQVRENCLFLDGDVCGLSLQVLALKISVTENYVNAPGGELLRSTLIFDWRPSISCCKRSRVEVGSGNAYAAAVTRSTMRLSSSAGTTKASIGRPGLCVPPVSPA